MLSKMASFTTKQQNVLHRTSFHFIAALVTAFLLTVSATGDPFGFDETKGTTIFGREFLLSLSVDHPQTGALLKVHNLANSRASVRITIYGESAPRITNRVISPRLAETITVSPAGLTSGPFVVNVTSSQNITLVAMRNGTATTGSYTVYPVDNAGIFYDIVSFPSANESQQSEISVIGVEDNSEVTFQSPCNFTVHGQHVDLFQMSVVWKNNETVFFTAYGVLNRTQSVVFRSITDLTGATVSGRPKGGRVVVISGSYCPSGSCDILMEQMPPIQTLGNSYFIVPLKDYAGINSFRMFSPWDNTTVTKVSYTNTESFLLNKGEYQDIDLPKGSVENMHSIHASNPIILMHYLIRSNNSGVSSMTLIPSVEQFTSGNSSFTTYNATSNGNSAVKNFINIVTFCDYKNYVWLNRRPITQRDWTTCPPFQNGGPTYCVAQKQLVKSGVYTLQSDSRHPYTEFSAIQYGTNIDQSAFANTVLLSFKELTCNVYKGGVVIPCKSRKLTTTTPSPTTLPTRDPADEETTMISTFLSETEEMTTGNATDIHTSTGHRKAGTVLAVVIGIITLVAGIVALAMIANAACGKRSKWKRLHNQGTDTSITLDSVSV